jgi:thiamine transporter ThiT
MNQVRKNKIIFIAITYFALLMAFSLFFDKPLRSIFLYAIPVVIIAARCGWRAGFFLSLLATLIAWFGQAFPTVPENAGLEFEEALITLAELVIASVVASAVARKISGVSKDKLFD